MNIFENVVFKQWELQSIQYTLNETNYIIPTASWATVAMASELSS